MGSILVSKLDEAILIIYEVLDHSGYIILFLFLLGLPGNIDDHENSGSNLHN